MDTILSTRYASQIHQVNHCLNISNKVPQLVVRIMMIIDAYYTYQVFGDHSPHLALCDFQDPPLMAYNMCMLGYTFVSHPILHTLLKCVPKFAFLIQTDHPPNSRCNKIAVEYIKARTASQRPPMTARKTLGKEVYILEGHRAQHCLIYMLVPIWSYLAHKPRVPVQEATRQRALKQLVNYTSDMHNLLLTGRAAYRMLSYEEPMMTACLNRWLSLGGLPGLAIGSVCLPILQQLVLTDTEPATYGTSWNIF
jgi:hypothetical protein